MKVKKYTKKPVTIEAIKWDGNNVLDIIKFCNRGRKCGRSDYGKLEIYTLEGIMIAEIGDYIIKGIKGEFYPCKPDIFEKTYKEFQDEKSIFKEFEEKGYNITEKIAYGQLFVIEKGYSLVVYVYKTKKEYRTMLGEISIELHQLLHKLFEIWEWFDE